MDPATAFWLAQTEDEHRNEAITAMKLMERKLVLCPINDSQDGSTADGGTHWGLLVWVRQAEDSRFLYYDSGFSHLVNNREQAQALAKYLAGHEVAVKAGACAKQSNSWDCGMYVIFFSELIVQTFLNRAAPVADIERPDWEARLAALTPKEVADRRASFYHALSSVSAAAVAGG